MLCRLLRRVRPGCCECAEESEEGSGLRLGIGRGDIDVVVVAGCCVARLAVDADGDRTCFDSGELVVRMGRGREDSRGIDGGVAAALEALPLSFGFDIGMLDVRLGMLRSPGLGNFASVRGIEDDPFLCSCVSLADGRLWGATVESGD